MHRFMPKTQPPAPNGHRTHVPVSAALSKLHPSVPAGCGSLRCQVHKLQDGVELILWQGIFEQTVELPLMDDADRIYFSFSCGMKGGASCIFDASKPAEHEIRDNSGTIQYGPGRRGIYRQKGSLQNLSVVVRPDVFSGWAAEVDPGLSHILRSGGFLDGHRSGELLAAAHALAEALRGTGADGTTGRHPLWLQAQSTLLVGLFLEVRGRPEDPRLPEAAQRKLLQVRDRLLADLSLPPVLSCLAREAGLSVPTLTRGFRRLFGTSPYELFQQERMQAARLRLMRGDGSVSAVAADLGYTNTSHFASAFRKQFGITPGAFKRQ